jgi:L-asparaginase II
MTEANPVLVEQRRGDYVESAHRGAAVVVDVDGQIIRQIGDVERPLLINSALKLAQALPFIATGAAERWGCNNAEITLAAASQIGQEFQRNVLQAWLARLGLPPASLKCGNTEPYDRGARNALVKLGQRPGVFHNNNAGKHISILATALHLGEPVSSYLELNHPAQARIRRDVARALGLADTSHHGPVDRCMMPCVPLSLRQLSIVTVKIGTGQHLDADLALASSRLIMAIRAEPTFLGGPDRLSTSVCQITSGRVIVKGGNEGAYTAVDTFRGRGYALKIDDGAGRAADLAIISLMMSDSVFQIDELERVSNLTNLYLKSYTGDPIGRFEPTARLAAT